MGSVEELEERLRDPLEAVDELLAVLDAAVADPLGRLREERRIVAQVIGDGEAADLDESIEEEVQQPRQMVGPVWMGGVAVAGDSVAAENS